MSGIFITFEGIDGCGKTTQLGMLAALLAAHSIPHIVTREPGGTKIGNKIRQIVLDNSNQNLASTTELLLYAADRAQHVCEELLPALADNKIVLCDRYTDSTVAYQSYGRNLPKNLIDQLNNIATNGLTPDLTLLFDLEVEQAEHRMSSNNSERNKDRLENEQRDFHQRVRQAYLNLAKEFPQRFIIISTAESQENVFQKVCRFVIPKIQTIYPNFSK